MPLAAGSVNAADVEFVGGWKCTYIIADQYFECVNQANMTEIFRRGAPGDPVSYKPYSGYYAAGVFVNNAWQPFPSPDTTCYNNACAQCFSGHGPIPDGSYIIDQGYLDPERELITYPLRVVSETYCDSKAGHPRDGFLIHYGTPPPANFSTGCIIIPDAAGRDTLNRYGGGILEVKERQAGFDPGVCKDAHLGAGWTQGTLQAQCKGLEYSP